MSAPPQVTTNTEPLFYAVMKALSSNTCRDDVTDLDFPGNSVLTTNYTECDALYSGDYNAMWTNAVTGLANLPTRLFAGIDAWLTAQVGNNDWAVTAGDYKESTTVSTSCAYNTPTPANTTIADLVKILPSAGEQKTMLDDWNDALGTPAYQLITQHLTTAITLAAPADAVAKTAVLADLKTIEDEKDATEFKYDTAITAFFTALAADTTVDVRCWEWAGAYFVATPHSVATPSSWQAYVSERLTEALIFATLNSALTPNLQANFVKAFPKRAPESSSSGLATGWIVTIVLAVLLVVAIGTFVGLKYKKPKTPAETPE